jgi:tetratricopeptide (TPR) repeat protein
MKQNNLASIALRVALVAILQLILWPCPSTQAQIKNSTPQPESQPNQPANAVSSTPEAELQTGISLTRQRHFRDAIPHLLAAHGRVTEGYAADFNLALCYVAIGQPQPAILVLKALSNSGHPTAPVENLLAQAYVADNEPDKAFDALQQASALTPQDEKLYLFITDACMDHKSYALGVRVADLGLQNVPRSAHLLYERALFLTYQDRLDLAKKDFDRAREVAPESDTAYMAAGQENLLEGNIPEAIHVAREGVGRFKDNYVLLQLLGEALIHSGVDPGQPEFAEAQAALEKSVVLHPDYSHSQIALGKLYLMGNRLDDAIAHLESARQLEPDNTSVYSHLATAYRRKGESQESQKMLAILASLNDEQAAKIRSGPPVRQGSSASPRVE